LGQGHLRLLRSLPGPQNDASILTEFCARGDGLVTALDSKHLAALRYAVPSESEVELLELGRMVASYARLAGADPRSLVSSAHTIAAIGRICEDLEGDSPFYGSRRFAGLHRRLGDTLKELGDWGFEPDSLGDLAPACSADLQKKILSLAGIWKQTENLLSGFGSEFSYRHVAHCLASKPEPDVTFPRCLIFLDGELAPKHVDWIRWAVSVGGHITIVAESSPSTDGLFPTARLAERFLETPGELTGDASPLVSSLFAGTIATDPGREVDRFQAADPLAEVEWALRRCLEHVQGRDFHRLGIFVRNLEEYGPLIEAAATRLELPIRLARRAKLVSNGFIRALIAVLESLCSPDVRRLQILARSSYFLFPNALRKPFSEALTTAFRDGEQAWSKLDVWAEEQKEALPWLPAVLAWRREAVTKPTNLVSWRERVGELGKMFPAITASQISERDLRAKNSLERALGARATFLEKTEMRFEEALVDLKQAAEESDFTLPPAAYGLQVSDAPNGFATIDHLFVLGMLEGVFPRRRSESPILTDADRQEISERRNLMFPLPNSFEAARRERDAFVSLCAVPSKGLTFSHPETTDDRDNIEAFYLEEVKRALGGALPHLSYPRSLIAPASDDCRSARDKALRTALDAPPLKPGAPQDLGSDLRDRLLALVPERLEPRDLRTALECPFRHFAQETLRLYPDRDRRRWYQLRQLPQETHLIRQPNPGAAIEVLRSQLESELEQMRPHVPESEWQLLKQGGERLIQDWVKREFRAREIWSKEPGSVLPNVQFGAPTLRDELPRVGKLAGTVAGTSRMGPYKVIHMVESNTPSQDKASLLGLKDRDALYYGLHLMAGFEKGGAGLALEVESMAGRKMLLLPRLDEPPIVGDVESGLEVVDLAGKGDAPVTREVFFERVKDLLGQAAKAIREVDVHATNGDHCTFCDHGELCRQSAEFGESDSPFEGEDE
jgi:hypothetical protein